MMKKDIFDRLPSGEREDLENLFQTCPANVFDAMDIVHVKKGDTIIRSGKTCSYIYIFLEGNAQGVEMHLEEKIYVFKSFSLGRIVGELEYFLEKDVYDADIQAVTDCTLVRIPQKVWFAWVESDIRVLRNRSRYIISELTKQLRSGREYLFLDCYDRMILYFLQQYENSVSSVCVIKKTRPQLADLLGFSTRTINRSIGKMENEGLLTTVHGKIHISPDQAEKMQNYSDQMFLAES